MTEQGNHLQTNLTAPTALKAYRRHPGSLYRVFIRLGYRRKAESTKKKSKHNGHYDTPKELGKKWQMDVKYVPSACYAGEDGEKFYQYTMLEEASRKRFIYAYRETGGYSTRPEVTLPAICSLWESFCWMITHFKVSQ